MSNLESKICSQCGKIQEEESIFCGSCGADLSSKTVKRSIDNRTLSHRPLENEEFSRKSRTSSKISRFTPGSQDSGEFDKSTFDKATYTPSREYATKAIVLAIIGIFTFLLFIPFILGLRFVSIAEMEKEDRSMIILAKVLLWFQLFGWITALIIVLIRAYFLLST